MTSLIQRILQSGCAFAPASAATFDLAFDKAFTLREVAERLGISLRQVQAHVADGRLVTVNVGRGLERKDLRVLDDDLEDFVRRLKSFGAPLPRRGGPRRRPPNP